MSDDFRVADSRLPERTGLEGQPPVHNLPLPVRSTELLGLIAEPSTPSPLDAAETVRAIVDHLRTALLLATTIGRTDWSRKMEGLIRQVEGGRARVARGAPSMPLVPVGPPIDLLAWVDRCIASLTDFRSTYMVAHEEDPDTFPQVRPASEWFEEWGGPKIVEPASPEAGDPDESEDLLG